MTKKERASEAFTEIVEALFDSQVEELEDLIDIVSTYLNKEEISMSILQEYDEIRKFIGEEEYSLIQEYLSLHPEVSLADIYYNEEPHNKFQQWKKLRR